jgi:hypothetical protein
MKVFSKLHIFVPMNTYEAADQLKTAIKFLACLCGDMTIAIGGYRKGLYHLEKNRKLFEAIKDKMFLLNYLYMLDRVFQAFCSKIKKYEDETDPIQEAKESSAEGWMERMIDVPMAPWLVTGTIPVYGSPLAWEDKGSVNEGVQDISSGRVKSSGGSGSGSTSGEKKKRQAAASPDSKELPWHKEIPAGEYVKEWCLPVGKRFFDFFGPDKKENYAGIPKVKHHGPSGRPSPVCLRYIIENGPKCKKGFSCGLSHIKMGKLTREEKDAITIFLKNVYEGAAP